MLIVYVSRCVSLEFSNLAILFLMHYVFSYDYLFHSLFLVARALTLMDLMEN